MNKPQNNHSIRFVAMNPTRLAIVDGFPLYEHPRCGDESPLLTITRSGHIVSTPWFEVDDVEADELHRL